ncbi:mechanosensitive ion channel, partial [Candidatus Poribacteria bacterium]|nr:mechanosensitive ion channel [Candidatus Poribacteria bacterium]
MGKERIVIDLNALMPLIASYAAKVLGVLVLFFVSFRVAAWARRVVTSKTERAGVESTLAQFFGAATRWVVLLLSFVAILGVFDVPVTSFAAVIGGAALAIGLAFQGSLSNIASGVMLLVFRPFKVGDVVSVGGITAKVAEIELFSTTMDTPDNRRMILPNSSVFGSTIENVTFHPVRRVDVSVGVEYSAAIDRTREVLEQSIVDVPGQDDERESQILLVDLGDSSVNWQVRVW